MIRPTTTTISMRPALPHCGGSAAPPSLRHDDFGKKITRLPSTQGRLVRWVRPIMGLGANACELWNRDTRPHLDFAEPRAWPGRFGPNKETRHAEARPRPSDHHRARRQALARVLRGPCDRRQRRRPDPEGGGLSAARLLPPRRRLDGIYEPHRPRDPLPLQGRCELLHGADGRRVRRERGLELRAPLPGHGPDRRAPVLLSRQDRSL